MAAITQRVSNYLGGVSKQSDDKKLPNQVIECLNGYPDPTFGLTKRPGFKWLANLGTGTTYDNCKWFYIHRDNDERYIGCIKPASVAVTNNGTSGATDKTGVAVDATSGSGDTENTTVNLTASGGVVTGITIKDAGTGYATNDTITITAADAGTGANVVGTITLGGIDVWNATTGAVCDITYGTEAQAYLTGVRTNYDILTVQDTSIITNNLFTVTTIDEPPFTANKKATLILSDTPAGDYNVTIDGTPIDTVSTGSGGVEQTYDSILSALKTKLTSAGLTVTKFSTSLELEKSSAFTITCSGGSGNTKLNVLQEQVDNVSQLPFQSKDGRVVKIINTESSGDTYWAKFVAEDGTSGRGYWEETIDPTKSTGLTDTTMPHELINTGTNKFTFRKIVWTPRKVGDNTTNSHPSFVGHKIEQAFFHNNRLGFLSRDNVSMSQSQDFYNFYHISAQTVTDADPVDLSCSSIRPAALHGVVPTTQGLVLFSKSQQFLMSAADGILTPTTTSIRTISNYEMDTEVDPVDMGTNINFISKTPAYTRIFGMVTRGQDENPQVLDVGRVVNEWVPATIDTFIASPQNQFLALSSQSDRKVYFYRTYSDGEKNLVEAWFNWELMGTVQGIAVDQDDMYAVTKQGDQFTLSIASLSQSPSDAIIVNNDGSRINPCIDNYTVASSVVYKSVESLTITNGGTGYTSAPSVTITGITGPNPGTPGSGATATATLTGNEVTGITITNGGSGYTNGAVATFSGGDGSNAAATVNVFDGSKAYLPYNNESTLNPVLIIKGTTATGQFIESGFTINPERNTDGVGTYFKVPIKDLSDSSIASDVIVGWRYNLDIILPKTYVRTDERQSMTDYTATLTVARMKFAVGLSGVMGFKLKSTGIRQGKKEYTGDNSTKIFNWTKEDLEYINPDQIKVKLDGVVTTAFTVSGDSQITMTNPPGLGVKVLIYLDEWYNLNPTQIADTYLANDIALSEQSVFSIPIHQKTDNFQLRVFNDSPFPVSLNSMMWEGNYSPRFYRRY